MEGKPGAGGRPLLALLLSVPAPSLGVLAGMHLLPGTPAGAALYLLGKVWFFAFPFLWLRGMDRDPLRHPAPRARGYEAGLVAGLLLSGAVLLAWVAFGDRLLDPGRVSDRLERIGLGTPARYLAGALYWIAVNSLLEEYCWRWFCFRQCRALLPAPAAVALSALLFTVHHLLALLGLVPAPVALLCSFGVFAGAVVWGALLSRFGSLWPGYLSHALVDVAIFGIGAAAAFG